MIGSRERRGVEILRIEEDNPKELRVRKVRESKLGGDNDERLVAVNIRALYCLTCRPLIAAKRLPVAEEIKVLWVSS